MRDKKDEEKRIEYQIKNDCFKPSIFEKIMSFFFEKATA